MEKEEKKMMRKRECQTENKRMRVIFQVITATNDQKGKVNSSKTKECEIWQTIRKHQLIIYSSF